MEADNQNRWNSLQSKLERLTEIPGEPAFDTNAAWGKLSERLEKKAMHRKPVFYWAAAAFLLLIFSVTLYQFRQPAENKLVNNSTRNVRSSSNLRSNAEFKDLHAGLAKESIQPEQKITTPQKKTNSSFRTANKLSHKTVSSVLTTVINEPESKPGDSAAVAASSLSDTLAIVKVSPVKLKVIHNNRLNSVLYKQELSVSNAPTAFPPSSGNLRFSRNASDNIIQIKLSLTN
jgi:hypothetical protein